MAAKIIPGDLYTQAGLDTPYNGRYSPAATTTDENPLKANMRTIFQDIDKADAVNRFTWGNLPDGLTGQLLEEVLYHKGQGAFFYIEALDKFYFLPYALEAKEGTGLDPYGRFLSITPVPLAGGTVDKDGNAKPWIPGLTLDVDYDVVSPDELTIEHITNHAVILKDYTPAALTQTCIPRVTKQQGFIDIMSDCVPLLRTALINGVGITGIQTHASDEQINVDLANYQVQNAALNGHRYIALLSELQMQEIASPHGAVNAENYTRALQSLDNLRLSTYGIDNGGVYQKTAHMLQTEQDMAGGAVGLILQDGLTKRQFFCDIVNSIWGLGIWCDVSETVSGTDKNLDGELSDQTEPQTPAQEKTSGGAANEQ